jgi:hypothetical protein
MRGCTAEPALQRKPGVPRSATKPSLAQTLDATFSELIQTLQIDHRCTHDPGTAMTPHDCRVMAAIKDAVSRRVRTLCGELQVLVMACDECAERLWHAARHLPQAVLNRLQAVLDICGADEVTDYLRLELQLERPHTQSMTSTRSVRSAPSTMATSRRSHSARRGSVGTRHLTGPRRQASTLTGRQRSAGLGACAAPLRYDAIRAAGHPLLDLAHVVQENHLRQQVRPAALRTQNRCGTASTSFRQCAIVLSCQAVR